MRCIFCKESSDSSRSVEHIIPESLGNTQHVLPPGIVCDKCNNYFASKVEKPFLDADSIVTLRHGQQIANKRGFVPPLTAIHFESGVALHIGANTIYPVKERDFSTFAGNIVGLGTGRLFLPVYPQRPSSYITARFLCRIALEALAYRSISVPAALDEVVDKIELDSIRRYARFGDMNELVWEYVEREIYSENAVFREIDSTQYQVLHEFMFIQTKSQELIFIVAFFGTEYAISMERPDVKGYSQWLEENDGKSPLYS